MRPALVLLLTLALAPAARSATPLVTVKARGLVVTLSADAPVRWSFGDGRSAAGRTATHTYPRGGLYTVRAIAGDGETAVVPVTARGVTLAPPPVARYADRVTFRGAVVPPAAGTATLLRAGARVATAHVDASGRFRIVARILHPGGYRVAFAGLRSQPVPVVLRPLLRTELAGSRLVGGSLTLRAALHPAGGRLAVTLLRDGRRVLRRTFGASAVVPLDTSLPARLEVEVEALAAPGYAPVARTLSAVVLQTSVAYGGTGRAVATLTRSLASLAYAVPRTTSFDARVLDAVYAFQKVQGLPRTGVVGAATWRALAHPRLPRPRYASPADHLEVDKPHQVLYVVRGGEVAEIVPVSTAGLPGRFTPVGRFAIYRKVDGFDPSPLGVLYKPMYFTGGYAIHGNPSVPPYPASHGCVRVPMWIIPSLFETNGYGETVFVY